MKRFRPVPIAAVFVRTPDAAGPPDQLTGYVTNRAPKIKNGVTSAMRYGIEYPKTRRNNGSITDMLKDIPPYTAKKSPIIEFDKAVKINSTILFLFPSQKHFHNAQNNIKELKT